LRSVVNAPHLDQFESERFDLRQDAEQGGAIFKATGEDGL
jgi:hypothetical protein